MTHASVSTEYNGDQPTMCNALVDEAWSFAWRTSGLARWRTPIA